MEDRTARIEVPAQLWSNHEAHEVVLVRCVEPRLREYMDGSFMSSLGVEIFDGPITFAGGAMVLAKDCVERTALIKQLKLVQGMGVKRVILTVHPECGGYGLAERTEERKAQEHDLKAGTQFLKEAIPELLIEAYIGEIAEEKNGTVTFVFRRIA